MTNFRLALFGSPQVFRGSDQLVFPSRKVLALLIYLAVERKPFSREYVATLFWPESDAEHARGALRRTLAWLKTAVQTDSRNTQPFLLVTRLTLAVDHQAPIELDLSAVERAFDCVTAMQLSDSVRTPALQRGNAAPSLLATLHAAVAAYRGDFLAGFVLNNAPAFDDWVDRQRAMWHQRMGLIYDRLSQVQAEAQDYPGSIDTATRWVAHDPLHEPAYRRLMEAYWAAGNRSAALRTYAVCQTVLATELGVSPEPQLVDLATHIRSAVLPTHTPSHQEVPHNLPPQPNSLIGRDADCTTACQLLQRTDVRLLTLVGPPGVGKTRLALHVAAGLRADFAQGAWLVDLASLDNPALVASTIATTLGVQETADRSITHSLMTYLRDRELLLVLDNFEHLLSAANVVAELLHACPLLKVVVTSREHLGLRWEQQLPVLPLALPNMQRPLDASVVTQSAAVQLFLERARAVLPAFELTPETVGVIARLCVRLDGLPLAIELAAARVALLSPAAMLDHLQHYRTLPRAAIRDVPARHQTLHAAMDVSYKLLDITQQKVFRRLAVFVGGWTLSAAAAVVDATELDQPVLEVLAVLVDQHLVYTVSANGEQRFRMLETIRAYAFNLLQSHTDFLLTQQRHAAYIADLAERAEANIRSSEQVRWITQLQYDHDNVRSALEWTVNNGMIEMGLRIAAAIGAFWSVRGYFSEGRRWLESLLVKDGAVRPDVRAKALNSASVLVLHQGDYNLAQRYQEEALAYYRQVEDALGMSKSLGNLGNLALHRKEYARASVFYEEALALFRRLNDPLSIAKITNNLALIAISQKDHERAIGLVEEALAIRRMLDDTQGVVISLCNLGELHLMKHQYTQAAAYYAECLTLAQHILDQKTIAACLDAFAVIASAQGSLARAAWLWGAAEVLRESMHIGLAPTEFADRDRVITTVRTELGVNEFTSAWQAGRAASIDQVLNIVSAHHDPVP